jgi:predicted nuclease of predicted toxin-antitoxin system
MKLLFDNNLSPKLVKLLKQNEFKCAHVVELKLESASDLEVWRYAQNHDFTLVSKDSDFVDLLFLRGFPPKLIWIKMGNCRTTDIAQAFTRHQEEILRFINDADLGLLELNQ